MFRLSYLVVTTNVRNIKKALSNTSMKHMQNLPITYFLLKHVLGMYLPRLIRGRLELKVAQSIVTITHHLQAQKDIGWFINVMT